MEIPRSVRAVLLVPLLMACLSGPALAQDSTAYLRRLRGIEIPLPEAQFVLYQYVAGSDDVEPDERLQAEVRSELGFGNARFYALIDHMRETITASRKFADARNSAICARRAKLESVQALGPR